MDIETTKNIVQIIESLATVIAIVVGGFWTYGVFIRHRQKYPRAMITHQIVQKPIGRGKTLFLATIQIENKGDVLVKINRGEVRLLQVLPLIGEIQQAVATGNDPVKTGYTSVDWHLLGKRSLSFSKPACEIEPGETDIIQFDFIVEDDVRFVQLYSYFKNEQKGAKEIGWTNTTFYEIPRKGNSRRRKWLTKTNLPLLKQNRQ